MFLTQYFCLHGILPFSKSYLQNETPDQPQSAGEESLLTLDITTLCVTFSVKSEATNVFPKHILKLKARDQSLQARKKLFCHVIVKNYLHNVSCKFLIQIESTWRREIKEQTLQLTLLHRSRTVRSSHRRCSIRQLFLKISQYPLQAPVLESIFKKVADL